MFRHAAILLLSGMMIATVPCVVKAQSPSDDDPTVIMPRMESDGILIDDDLTPPVAPRFVEIQYLKPKELSSLTERVSKLIYGVDIDVAPEYDMYGYEIRRYMVEVGNPQIYKDRDFLKKQIINVRKAKVVLKFWQQDIDQQMKDLDMEMDKQNASSSIRTAYRQNKTKVRSFMVDMTAWIDSNERLINYLYSREDLYYLDYPKVGFIRPPERIEYYNMLRVRQINLIEIRK